MNSIAINSGNSSTKRAGDVGTFLFPRKVILLCRNHYWKDLFRALPSKEQSIFAAAVLNIFFIKTKRARLYSEAETRAKGRYSRS